MTETAFAALLLLGAAVLVSGLLATIYFYIRIRRARTHYVAAPSLLRYFAFALVLAFASYVAGSALGIFAGCSVRHAGNLCGIWGALGSGPLLAGLALWSYGPWWQYHLSKSAGGGAA